MSLGFRSPVMEPRLKRTQFLNAIRSIAGTKPVACYLPSFTDSLTSIDPISGRVWTADAAMNGQVKPWGYGFYRTFNGTSNWLNTPDTTDLSFGNGTTDSAFSVFALVNVTDTAAARAIVTKQNTSNGEYRFIVNATDNLRHDITDQSVAVAPPRISNAAITQGSWRTFADTYTAVTGGANAANDMTLYQDGAVIASTPTAQAGYVAMENLAALVEIGSETAHTASFFSGNIALVLIIPGALLAAQVASLHAACKTYFGI